MTKKINVTCEKCKENFIFTTDSSVVDKVLDEGHYICFTCEDKMEEEKMMTEIGIKFEEEQEQLEDIIKKVIEVIEKTKEEEVTTIESTKHESTEVKKACTVMYLETRVSHYSSEVKKVYFGRAHNTLSKEYATEFNVKYTIDREKVDELKSQGWKSEFFYR